MVSAAEMRIRLISSRLQAAFSRFGVFGLWFSWLYLRQRVLRHDLKLDQSVHQVATSTRSWASFTDCAQSVMLPRVHARVHGHGRDRNVHCHCGTSI